jgi:UDP-glucose 4-epimerase
VFLAQMLANKPLTIVGDGKQKRDFTYVSDAVSALLVAAASERIDCYNVGSDNPVSINHLINLLGAQDVVHIPKRPGEPDCTWADTRRIKSHLGWSAGVSIEQGVRQMLAHIDYWRDAPVWTPESIAVATADWFNCLGPRA